TLIEIEALEALSGDLLNRSGEQVGITLSAPDSRRNIATSGVPLNHLVDREFRVGSVLMRGTRLCEPGKHLENLTRRGLMSGLIHRHFKNGPLGKNPGSGPYFFPKGGAEHWREMFPKNAR